MHGEAEKLARLHQELVRRFSVGDRIVYLGNYLGRGRDILATLDELVLFRRELLCTPGAEPEDIVYLRGAQEEMWRKLLQLQFAPSPRQVFDWMIQQGVGATLAAYGGNDQDALARLRDGALSITRWTGGLRDAVRSHPGHDELLAGLKRAAYTEGGELLFAHAGVDPNRPLSEQSDAFWWGNGYFAGMNEPYAGYRLVVSGFDRGHAVRMGTVSACIDGGAGFGGKLNAACFNLEGRAVDWLEV
ncbi:MAG TPA: hypothetical protein VEU47_15150 [Candidatus Cybelea sp.]|nr:hypothetical protein [Candidatus Cybelea sp.]